LLARARKLRHRMKTLKEKLDDVFDELDSINTETNRLENQCLGMYLS